MNEFLRVGVCIITLLSLTACGTLQITVEGKATSDAGAAVAATVGALQTQNAELATKAAVVTPSSGDVAQPTQTAAPTVPPATRITFLNGASVGVVSAPIAPDQTQEYVLDVFEGQPMYVYVASANNDVTVSIKTEDGATILDTAERKHSWQGSLPQMGDYYLTIHGGASTENFSLTVTIPWRIQFAAGADSATVSGKTVAGYDVSYTVYARQGQDMRIDLENRSSKASLAIYGFSDGRRYLASDAGQDSYRFVLPATQDYIVVVVPYGGSEVSYTMTVTIQ